ncbi:carbohydrate sulfotransferase 10-like isoform X2 [Xenopus tropicalis]|uniref:Carbohydrate sulfotransferase n=1 Tax=Xenopus tropicalis TaxID=8364 RepID=A0A8J0R507_XENTR|nr:carbohydrate sulfotransferase 10-like isoform X2 [Xenopus tropicalis]|eukprot:XP_004914871.1 PREDICTED: carbohydrate sulfotransferase 10-like isoform X2 [Xenopus tropicalis]
MRMRFALRVSLLGIIGLLVWVLGRLLSQQQDPEATSPTLSITVDTFLHVQQVRKKKLHHFCLEHPDLRTLQTAEVAQNLLSTMAANQKLQMLYCKPTSEGRDLWEELLKQIEERADITIQSPVVYDGPRDSPPNPLSAYNLSMLEKVFQSYTKVLLIRDPFERLVSSYLQDSAGEVTFDKFLEDGLTDGPGDGDGSWTPIVFLCHPCFIRYDYIVKYDFFNTEVLHLMKRMGLPESALAPLLVDNGSMWAYKWLNENLLQLVTKEHIEQIIEIYSWDFEAFPFKISSFWNIPSLSDA